MNDKRHCTHVFYDVNGVKFLRELAQLRETRAELVHMNDIPASVQLRWDFGSAKKDSCEAARYFTAGEEEVKNWNTRCRKGLQKHANSRACYLKTLGAAFDSPRNIGSFVHISVQPVLTGASNLF